MMGAEDVFISYRGAADSLYAADLLHAELSHVLGPGRVFLDSESIKPGADFVRTLVDRVRQSRVVLAVIGPHWLTVTDPDGLRRIDDPRDWVRRELAEAFDADVPVIPVLTDNARMPTEADLPADIVRLGRAQHVVLRQRHAQADIAVLLDRLTDLVPDRQRDPVVPAGPPLVPRQLPLVMGDFVGRGEQLATLDALLPADEGAGAGAGAVMISAVGGTAGVGKTKPGLRHRL
ncbi:MAG TPA: toll/interleukin-1 receptor domain-containing protein [Pseudonocardiaceae bacterium]|nr:toll/interleukin-1 receptor domain-containing protein [Pseudonocardiaceae bacterium]